MKSVFGIVLVAISVVLFGFSSNKTGMKVEVRKDFKRFFEQNGVSGSIMIYDQSKLFLMILCLQ